MLAGRSAFARAYMTPPVDDPTRQLAFDNILIEFDRDPGATTSSHHGHLFVAYAENDDARAIQVLAPAS
jgi:hypothetical protein